VWVDGGAVLAAADGALRLLSWRLAPCAGGGAVDQPPANLLTPTLRLGAGPDQGGQP